MVQEVLLRLSNLNPNSECGGFASAIARLLAPLGASHQPGRAVGPRRAPPACGFRLVSTGGPLSSDVRTSDLGDSNLKRRVDSVFTMSRVSIPVDRPYAHGFNRYASLMFSIVLLPFGAYLLWNCVRHRTLVDAFAGLLFVVGGTLLTYFSLRAPLAVELSDDALILHLGLAKRSQRIRRLPWNSIAGARESRLAVARVPIVDLRSGESITVEAITTHRRKPGPWQADAVSAFVAAVNTRVAVSVPPTSGVAEEPPLPVLTTTSKDPWADKSPFMRWVVRPVAMIIALVLDGL